MKNLSFGRIYTLRECRNSTMKQMEIAEIAYSKFQAIEDFTSNKTIEKMLEENMGVDVYITHKKNGDTEIELKDSESGNASAEVKVRPKDKIKLTLNRNLPYKKIKKMLTEYSNKCRRLANSYLIKDSDLSAQKISDETESYDDAAFPEMGCSEV